MSLLYVQEYNCISVVRRPVHVCMYVGYVCRLCMHKTYNHTWFLVTTYMFGLLNIISRMYPWLNVYCGELGIGRIGVIGSRRLNTIL